MRCAGASHLELHDSGVYTMRTYQVCALALPACREGMEL